MTEQQWLASIDTLEMLFHVEENVSGRKLRLLACACCRQESVWRFLTNESSRVAIGVSEQFADGQADDKDLIGAALAIPQGRTTGASRNPRRLSLHCQATRAAVAATRLDEREAANETLRMTANSSGSQQSDLLREIIGNPFRLHLVSTFWLAWNDGTVPRLARDIYEDRTFADLPILSDALEEAGCDDGAILDHLRSPGPHVRGCWALDLVLGKE